MALKAVYEKLDEVPENFHELYSERGGKYELTGIEGVKSQADVDRLSASLAKERKDHKEAKERLGLWGDLKFDEVRAKLDSFEELQARADAAADPAKNAQAIEAAVKVKTAPMERDLTTTRERLAAAEKLIGEFKAEKLTRTIHDEVRKERKASGVKDSAEDDVLLLAERVFEVNEDGKVVTRDNVGVTPGIDPKTWLMEMQPKREHWWPESTGGGAKGGNGNGAGVSKNPWTYENWNLTQQFEYASKYGPDKAAAAARAAGSIKGQRPAPKAS